LRRYYVLCNAAQHRVPTPNPDHHVALFQLAPVFGVGKEGSDQKDNLTDFLICMNAHATSETPRR
jgi:hypothetical protein